MECQECQENPATLHFTKVVNGFKTEVHVCEACAKEKGYMGYEEEAYSLHNLLSGLFNFESSGGGEQQTSKYPPVQELSCPKCGMTYQEFSEVGKFGCAGCYQTFADRLNPVLRRVHSGNTRHDGKIPKRKGTNLHQKRRLESYKEELRRLIESQEFEQAAQVRDQIKAIEESLQQDREGEE